jgi:vitamin B12 transport system ATP-binding protein
MVNRVRQQNIDICQLALTGRLQAFSACIEPGTRVHVIGPNGSGKSSLLARIAQLLAGQGTVLLGSQDLARCSGKQLALLRGYLCQNAAPLTVMPVFQYLGLHLPAYIDALAAQHTITLLCERLRLLDKLERWVTQLSGGEWQRVRVAACLLQVWPTLNPHSALLVLDEPANSLDIAQQHALDMLIDEFCALGGIAVISDHDLNHSLHHASQVWMMKNTCVLAAGNTRDVMQPDLLSEVFEVPFELHVAGSQQWLIHGD